MRIYLGTDRKYLVPTLLTVWNLNRQAKSVHDYKIVYFTKDLSESDVLCIAEMSLKLRLRLEALELDSADDYKPMGHLTRASYLRLKVQEIESAEFLWLDSDLCANQGWDQALELDLERIEKIDPRTGGVAAVLESDMGRKSTKPLTDTYFNAGVIVFRQNSMQRGVHEEAFSELSASPELWNFGDQDVLNLTYSGKVKNLTRQLNVDGWNNQKIQDHDWKILHYLGPMKPWHLPLKLRRECVRTQCSWSPWYESYEEFRIGLRENKANHLIELMNEFESFDRILFQSPFRSVDSNSLKVRLAWSLQGIATTRRLIQAYAQSRRFNLHPYHW